MKSHRGLSAIVGAVFLIAIVVGALSYITYSLETMANFSEQLVADESRQKNIQDEQFEITSIDVTSGKLNAVIKNTGQIPLKITTLYIDEQGVNDVVNKTIIEKTIAPGTSFDFLTESIDIDIDPTKGYNLKMITSRGGSQTFSINSGSTEPLYMSLHILPATVSQNFPATLLFVVVNNMTSNNSLYNLTPVLDIDSSVGLATFLPATPTSTPTEYPVLKPGDVATFEYKITVDGIEGEYLNVAASLQNGYSIDSTHLQSINATITVKDVETAISSGSSITSLGLQSSESIEADVLYFHESSFGMSIGWPTYSKQMDGTEAFSGGAVLNTDDNPILFVTSNMTTTHTLLQGQWNASLQYYSNATAPGVPDPSFAFFFESDHFDTDKVAEATGNLDLVKAEQKGYMKEKNAAVTYVKYGGPHNDGYFEFRGEDSWLKLETKSDGEPTNTYTPVDSAPDTDAMWIRIPTATETYMPVTFFGENKDNKDKDRYEVYIGDGSGSYDGFIFFNIYDQSADDNVTCRTNDNYDNGKWQFLTVVRTDDTPSSRDNCEIWINGTNPPGTNTPGSTSLTTGYTVIEDDGLLGDLHVKEVGIGSVDEKALFTLNADIAMWMHWDDEDLEPSEIEDLFYTNYGENGTRLDMTIQHCDDDGSTCVTIIDVDDFVIPFYDPSANSTQLSPANHVNALFSNADSDALWKYSRFNVTGTSSSGSSLVIGDRFSVTFTIDDDEQNLPINLWFNDADYQEASLDDTNSFLQTPEITPIWPTFANVISGQTTTLTIFNEGPEGIWLTFPGTRFVVTTEDGLVSYGAMPYRTNAVTIGVVSSPLDAKNDSPYIVDQGQAQLKFEHLCNPVSTDPNVLASCEDIPEGDYLGFIYLAGYDETGASFVRSISLGSLHVFAP